MLRFVKLIREHWKLALAVVWSVVAVVELVKGDYLFAAVATIFAVITFWDHYRRARHDPSHQVLGNRKS